MSRAYRIRVSESTSQTIRVADGVRVRLQILQVLPGEQMAELLAAELEARGFSRDGDTMTRVDDDGVEIAVDLAGGHITVRLEREADVDFEVTRERTIDSDHRAQREAAVREQLHDKVQEALASKVESERAGLGVEIAETLEKKLLDLRRELGQIENRVTAEALKVRAGQLGEIKEITEDPETGSLTIKVSV